LRQGPHLAAQSLAEARTLRKWEINEVHVLLSVYGSCGGVAPVRALGAEVPVGAASDFAGVTSDRS
jgi:hypothetical protein